MVGLSKSGCSTRSSLDYMCDHAGALGLYSSQYSECEHIAPPM